MFSHGFQERVRFLNAWTMRHYRARSAFAVAQAMDAGASKCLRWIEQMEDAAMQRRLAEAAELPELRASIIGASALLVDACEMAGLPLGAVAYGILSQTYRPLPGDGFPCLPTGSPEHISAMKAALFHRKKDYWGFKNRTNGVVIRPAGHPDGRWAAQLFGGILQTDIELGPVSIRTYGTHARLLISTSLPETVLAGCVGMPISRIISHPLLDSRPYLIKSAKTGIADRLTFTLGCDHLPIGDCLASKPARGPIQLGRSSLVGEAAVADLVVRSSLAIGRVWNRTSAVHEDVLDRLHRINLMAPPWGEQLKAPDAEEVARILKDRVPYRLQLRAPR